MGAKSCEILFLEYFHFKKQVFVNKLAIFGEIKSSKIQLRNNLREKVVKPCIYGIKIQPFKSRRNFCQAVSGVNETRSFRPPRVYKNCETFVIPTVVYREKKLLLAGFVPAGIGHIHGDPLKTTRSATCSAFAFVFGDNSFQHHRGSKVSST